MSPFVPADNFQSYPFLKFAFLAKDSESFFFTEVLLLVGFKTAKYMVLGRVFFRALSTDLYFRFVESALIDYSQFLVCFFEFTQKAERANFSIFLEQIMVPDFGEFFGGTNSRNY